MKYSKYITACLVIHNEEAVIRRCLESVKKVTDTILVVHDGLCSDRSLAICKEMGCIVFKRKAIGEAEPHRVFLLKKVQTPFCLQIDADEFLSPEFISHIPIFLRGSGYGYTCLWPLWDGNKYVTKNWPRKMVLFRMKNAQFLGVPHEAVRVHGSVVDTPYVLNHQPTYNNFTFTTFRRKMLKWAKIHAASYLPSTKIQSFGYPNGQEPQPHYARLMKHPLLFCVPLFVYHTTACIVCGAYKEGWVGIKSSFLMGLYYFFVAINVSILQRASHD